MVKIYTTSWCPHCNNAKRFLDSKGISYEEVDIEARHISRSQLAKITGGASVPQIQINGKSIGGYSNLIKLDSSGKLEALLGSQAKP